MSEVCPECETKAYLSSMDMSPEVIAEMVKNEPCPDYAGDEVYSRRLEICNSCSKLIAGMTCSNCGCFVQFRARHLSAVCVDGRW
ncbi:MAG: DUF6171 family protein [Treponema sp.]|nr:DUF6171 family protein [Treponema sp.]